MEDHVAKCLFWSSIYSASVFYSVLINSWRVCLMRADRFYSRTTSLSRAWLDNEPGRDPTDGRDLVSLSGSCSNSAHFFSISSSNRLCSVRWPVPLREITASLWPWAASRDLSSCHWLCSLTCPSPDSLWLAEVGAQVGATRDSST